MIHAVVVGAVFLALEHVGFLVPVPDERVVLVPDERKGLGFRVQGLGFRV